MPISIRLWLPENVGLRLLEEAEKEGVNAPRMVVKILCQRYGVPETKEAQPRERKLKKGEILKEILYEVFEGGKRKEIPCHELWASIEKRLSNRGISMTRRRAYDVMKEIGIKVKEFSGPFTIYAWPDNSPLN